MFLVSKDDDGDLIYVSDLVDDLELDDETPQEYVVQGVLPSVVEDFNSKFFAFAFQGKLTTMEDEERDIVMVLSGASPSEEVGMMGDLDFFGAQINYYKDDFCDLDPWEKIDPTDFSELTVPFRRSTTPQG